MVNAWSAAPASEKFATFQAALAVRQIEVGLASLFALVSGIAFSAYGLAIAWSDTYPKWLGWIGIAAGMGTAVSGPVMAYTGFSALAMNISMPSGFLLIVWLIVLGLLMWRRAVPVS